MGALQELFEDAGLETRSYSGRGMYGKRCLGVEVDGERLGQLLEAIVEGVDDDNRTELAESVNPVCTDSMGLGMIVYFPAVAYEADEDDGTDDDDVDDGLEPLR